MEEKIIWKLVFWEMKMLRDGWFSKPVFRITLKYGAYRSNGPETKFEEKKFKTLRQAFDYLEKQIEASEKVKL